MNVLVLNCGSSSLKAAVLDSATGVRVARVAVERIGTQGASVRLDGGVAAEIVARDHGAALEVALPALLERVPEAARPRAVGHRVVHGGERFNAPVRIDDRGGGGHRGAHPAGPAAQPGNLAGVRAARHSCRTCRTWRSSTRPSTPRCPPAPGCTRCPRALADKHGVRRYGFHGPSHQYVAQRAAEAPARGHPPPAHHHLPLGQRRQHRGHRERALGGDQHGPHAARGAGHGHARGRRGPGRHPHAHARREAGRGRPRPLLNKESGLAGLSGVGNDLRDIEARAAEGDERCRLAIEVFCHRLRKYIGSYAAVLGGVDVIVFTAGIGENSATIRHRVLQRLDFLGARLDDDKNRSARVSRESPTAIISEDHSRTRLMVVATDEEQAIASETAKLASDADKVEGAAAHPHRHQRAARAPQPPDAGAALRRRAKLTEHKPLSSPGSSPATRRSTWWAPRGASRGCASSARCAARIRWRSRAPTSSSWAWTRPCATAAT
jgi:acetate kinase